MRYSGSLAGGGAPLVRRFRIGANVTLAGSVVVKAASGGNGEIDNATATDASEGVGIALETGTYSTTQGTGANSAEVLVKCTYSPLQIIRGKVSNGATRNTDLDGDLDGQLLTNSTAETAGTVVADTDVGTSDFSDGYMIGLSGNNKGGVRVIDSHSNNTSETMAVPFDNDIAANDTFLRTTRPFVQGTDLSGDGTSMDQFDGERAAGESIALNAATTFTIWEVYIDDSNPSHGSVIVINETQPVVEFAAVFVDHAFNSIA